LLQKWQGNDAEIAIATQLGATLVSKGRTTGKKLDIKVSAAAGTCYLLVGSFAAQADESRLTDFAWTAASGRQVQELHVRSFPALAEAFCTLDKPEQLSAHAALDFAGTQNGVRWALLSFDRDHIPTDLSSSLVLERGDQCDPAYWQAIWTKPLAGTLVYADGREPVIVLDPRSKEVIWLNDPHSMTSPTSLASKPTGDVHFAQTTLQWGAGCPVGAKTWEPAKSATSKRIAACYARVQKKYGGTWGDIERMRSQAADQGGIAPAVEKHAVRVMKQQDRDNAACDAIDAAMNKTIAKLNERLVDKFLASPPIDATGRAELITRASVARTGRR
jgi:hypothetical protein